MRPPMWINASQHVALSQTVLPNIIGRIRSNSYNFEQFFVSATPCTASRSCLLTGLYAPQTAMYLDAGPDFLSPALNPAFPTWGQSRGEASIRPIRRIFWWFGKWHLSHETKTPPLVPYGFQTRTYPGGSLLNPAGLNKRRD